MSVTKKEEIIIIGVQCHGHICVIEIVSKREISAKELTNWLSEYNCVPFCEGTCDSDAEDRCEESNGGEHRRL